MEFFYLIRMCSDPAGRKQTCLAAIWATAGYGAGSLTTDCAGERGPTTLTDSICVREAVFSFSRVWAVEAFTD